MEAYAVEKDLSYTITETPRGTIYKCNYNTIMRTLIERYGAEEIAKVGSEHPPLLIGVTLDGAMFTKDLQHVMCGLKWVQPGLIHPFTGKRVMHMQSRDNQWPLCLAEAKDTKELYDTDLTDFFEFFLAGPVVITDEDGNPLYTNIKIVSPQDMKSHWCVMGIGGASSKYFCICCICGQDEKASYKTDGDRCKRCKRLLCLRCYCWSENDGRHLTELQALLDK